MLAAVVVAAAPCAQAKDANTAQRRALTKAFNKKRSRKKFSIVTIRVSGKFGAVFWTRKGSARAARIAAASAASPGEDYLKKKGSKYKPVKKVPPKVKQDLNEPLLFTVTYKGHGTYHENASGADESYDYTAPLSWSNLYLNAIAVPLTKPPAVGSDSAEHDPSISSDVVFESTCTGSCAYPRVKCVGATAIAPFDVGTLAPSPLGNTSTTIRFDVTAAASWTLSAMETQAPSDPSAASLCSDTFEGRPALRSSQSLMPTLISSPAQFSIGRLRSAALGAVIEAPATVNSPTGDCRAATGAPSCTWNFTAPGWTGQVSVHRIT